jgi:K+-sensing histidine kinase KdpD
LAFGPGRIRVVPVDDGQIGFLFLRRTRLPVQLSIFSRSDSVFCHLMKVRREYLGKAELLDYAQKRGLRRALEALLGASLCAIASVAVSAVSLGHSWQEWAPLAFVIVLLLTAALFGALAGILGTILSAIIFATFLFRPLGSILVSSAAARANLAWMLLVGMSYALLFAPPHGGLRRH